MYNWSVNTSDFKKNFPKKYKIWKIEQMINYGLNNEKLDEIDVRKYFSKLRLDPKKREYIKSLIFKKSN